MTGTETSIQSRLRALAACESVADAYGAALAALAAHRPGTMVSAGFRIAGERFELGAPLEPSPNRCALEIQAQFAPGELRIDGPGPPDDFERALETLLETKLGQLPAEASLPRTEQYRAERLRELGQRTAGVAHDMNNVLAAILGRVALLKQHALSGAVQDAVRVIEQAALDGAGTVRRIQRLAREPTAKIPVSLAQIVRETLEWALPEPINSICVEPDLRPAWVRAHPTELRQVLLNLVHNAFDALEGRGRVHVRCGLEGERAFFEVEDGGIGMSPETQRRVFDPFFTTKGARGTGLGLSVCAGLIRAHEGEISVASAPNQGTTVRVNLPAIPAPRANLESHRSFGHEAGEQARILVIDDYAPAREALADLLRTGDHCVVTAGSAAEGLRVFRSAHFDLVFTDLEMPDMNGREVAASVKLERPEIPVGLISGWGASLEDQAPESLGVDLILGKPFRYREVLRRVDEALGLHWATAANDRGGRVDE